jgi:hypothetical protein
MIYSAANQEAPTHVTFPSGPDVHWETEIRVMWNELECLTEKQELIYEVSWIRELGVWRRFLRSQRKGQN